MSKSASKEKASPWEKTKVQCLLRNRHSGKYYGRFTVNESQKWVSLDSDVFSVAKLRLPDEAAKINQQRGIPTSVRSGKATVGEFLDSYEKQMQADHAAVPCIIRDVPIFCLTRPDIPESHVFHKGCDSIFPADLSPAHEYVRRAGV